MRKHVTPADPGASIPDPTHGRPLPATGLDVEFSGYWIGLAARGDVIVSDALGDGGGAPDPLPDASQIIGGGYLLRVAGVERFFSTADLRSILAPLLAGASAPAPATNDNSLALSLDLGSSLAAF